jgi:hypothetical protein
MIAGWRYAKGASIAETARKFRVSADTVKRACRDHGEGALEARHAWFESQWHQLTDRLLFTYEKRGGYGRVVRNLKKRIAFLEARQAENEAAMRARGIPVKSSSITGPGTPCPRPTETKRWADVLGFDDPDESRFADGEQWEWSAFQERAFGW